MDSIKSCSTVLTGSVSVFYINNYLESYIKRLSLPFSVGDTVKIGTPDEYIEGWVEAITGQLSIIMCLAPPHCFILRYSGLSSTVIFRSIVKTLTLKIHDVDKISQISKDVVSMMRSNPNVSMEIGHPYCNCSQESSYVKLTLGCDFKNKKSEKYILGNAVGIIKEHGGELINDTRGDGSELGN